MAPLPPNLTNRLYVDYVTGDTATSKAHTLMVRVRDMTLTLTEMQDTLADFLHEIGAPNFAAQWRVTGLRWSNALTDFSMPIPFTASRLAAFRGLGAPAPNALYEASEYTFVGRALSSGVRARFSLYCAAVLPTTGFRLTGGGVGGAISLLNTASPLGFWVSADGSDVVWYPYVNTNINSYWERAQRLG